MKPRVLIVDDDFSVASLHERFVGAHGGFEVVGVARTGADALELVRSTRPDLVLLDVYLPDMTGIDVLRQLRADPESEHVDVIAITAARELDTVRSAMAGGVLHYLVKPFSAATLHDRLEDYLRHRSELRRSGTGDELDQAAVDRLLAQPRSSAAVVLPKGLSTRTLELVARALAARTDASATEVAEDVGVSRVSARRYLEHLVERGRADVLPKYGGPGRPENRYRALR